MKDTVKLEMTYPQSADQVWEALTNPNALKEWLMPADFEPLIGFRFRFLPSSGKEIRGKVLDVEKGGLLAYTWDDGETAEPSVVVWRLEETKDGTRLVLEHRYVETPEVTCIPMVNELNWRFALRYRLPSLLRILAGSLVAGCR